MQERIDHIFHKQLFGIAITELTSLLSRRSLYCSKYPNSKYSISRFGDTSGNIRQVKAQICGNDYTFTLVCRWMGLDQFRDEMIHCDHIREIHDFQNSGDCFSGVDIKGGISYFLYDRDNSGPCVFVSHEADKVVSKSERFLHENGCDVLIRYNELIGIYRKVHSAPDFHPFSSIVSGRSPFGLSTNHYGCETRKAPSDVSYFERKGFTFISDVRITKNRAAINKYKLYIPKTAEDGKLPGKVIGNITVGMPGTICSGTYLLVGPFETEQETRNVSAYMKTNFFRALVAVNKISKDAYAKVYDGVPIQDFSKIWTDEELFEKYGLTDEEVPFIVSMIKPMG